MKKQNSNKQAKRVKKLDEAKAQADEIVAAEIAKVKANPASARSSQWDGERVEGCTDEQWALAVKVRELREQGEPWWAIARDLEMEGFGDSATTGKKGASRARNAYAKGFGSHPRTFRAGGAYKGPVEQNANVAELKKMKVADLRAKAKSGKSVISKKMPDEEVAAMLKGRHIKWFSDEIFPEGVEYEAFINTRSPLWIIGEGKDRVIEFRERDPRAPADLKLFPGKSRTVRLRQIFSVK